MHNTKGTFLEKAEVDTCSQTDFNLVRIYLVRSQSLS